MRYQQIVVRRLLERLELAALVQPHKYHWNRLTAECETEFGTLHSTACLQLTPLHPKERVSCPAAGSMRTQAMAGGVSYANKPLETYEGF